MWPGTPPACSVTILPSPWKWSESTATTLRFGAITRSHSSPPRESQGEPIERRSAERPTRRPACHRLREAAKPRSRASGAGFATVSAPGAGGVAVAGRSPTPEVVQAARVFSTYGGALRGEVVQAAGIVIARIRTCLTRRRGRSRRRSGHALTDDVTATGIIVARDEPECALPGVDDRLLGVGPLCDVGDRAAGEGHRKRGSARRGGEANGDGCGVHVPTVRRRGMQPRRRSVCERYAPEPAFVDSAAPGRRMRNMSVWVLGPLLTDGGPLSPRERSVLSALILRAGFPVSADELADAVWGDEPPGTWPKQLQASIGRLRRASSVHARSRPAPAATRSPSTRIRSTRADSTASWMPRVRRRPTATPRAPRTRSTAHSTSGEAHPIPTCPSGRLPSSNQSGSPRCACRPTSSDSVPGSRSASTSRPSRGAERLVREQPLREQRWALLATALYRSGRQADALAAIRSARERLADELGIELGEELRRLETRDPAA